ncbi:PREDICTED: mucin-5AC [Chinchilla lanigera]|uniref:mucin-5AC n=1 Tax=Chinchilla lanigera TaxID=34839 RepID=UPI0006962F4F|nr:PREDICTED: mucin-5AC [Chinchilla lanigera]
MGPGRRTLAVLWALVLACAQHSGLAQEDSLKSSHETSPNLSPQQGHGGRPLLGVTVLPPLTTAPVLRALNPAHTGRVCSTWGDFHYKTFDGAVFRFPGLCNYVFSAHCGAAYEDFNVQLRRGPGSSATAPNRVVMKLNGLVVELARDSVLVNSHPVQLPFSQAGVLIEHSNGYVKVVAKLGLVFTWNPDDSLTLELDTKYANKTCGLCGDFNGVPEAGEFLSHNARLTPLEFGNLQKMDGPMEQCQDPSPAPQNCSISLGICEELLNSWLFAGCTDLVEVSGYVEACQQDLCHCKRAHLPDCLCHTLAEFSRQCAHAGGQPQDWRSPDLCPQTCSAGMQHRECGSPCTDTCSNPQRSQLCEDHCVASCFCPEGMVLDDIQHAGCVPVSQCACVYNGTSYAPGANYSTDCTECTCMGGHWRCQELPCPGTCSVLGGAHLSTFDEKEYTVHGDCSYVVTKPCQGSTFAVLAELRRCGLTDSETCLKSVTLSLGGGQTVVVVKASGEVFMNQIYTQLPVSAANVTILKPSTFFIIAETNLGLQLHVQLVPTMQLFVQLAPELQGQTCGLCGNFNQNQADDFRTISGVVEGTGAAFANTWKTQASCPNAKNSFEDPCSLSVENEKYAQHWCALLTDADGPFAQCHATVNPNSYYSNCMFDTCNCEKSEDCLCAALSSYVQACAAKGVLLRGWRDGVCTKPTTTCPKSMVYQEHLSTCQPTCRSLSEADVTCSVSFVPVDGCACPAGTFLDEAGACVLAHECPCYHGGSVVPSGESVHDSGAVCTCTRGTLTCIGRLEPSPACYAPMVYFDCRNATLGAAGASCQKSCHTLDMACYSTQCISGCVCPDGLVADGDGGCVAEEDCPCVHNEASYRPGETVLDGCNTCTCENRMWRCTDEPCLATCAVYGDGHFLTFDGQRYTFNGACEYTLVQDQCGGNGSAGDAFRVITENVPCGTMGTTCSKDIKIFLGSYELKLSSGKVEVVQMGTGQEPPYTVRQMGIYLVVDTDAGLVLLWDRKTSLFLMLSPEFKGRVCGLCGNFDDNAINDLTTRSQAVVGDALEFGNSWKFSPTCPDAVAPKDPCTANPYRKSWAQRQCSIINSATFATCHAHVEPAKYYEACVSDSCACDSGGDCECFCTAVAAYAQACHAAGVCVSWRTPDVCPLFCDYYNPAGECEWHYQPCGAPCLRTCRNPSGRCLQDLRGLEGCYPKCPPGAPIFDEEKMQCVAECPSSTSAPPCHIHGKLYRVGAAVPSAENCQSCVCTESGVRCTYDTEACFCTYDGRRFQPGAKIYHTTDGMGGCLSASCGANGTIERRVYACGSLSTLPPTTFTFSTVSQAKSSTHSPGTQPPSTRSTAPTGPRSSTRPLATHTSRRETSAEAPTTSWPCGEECVWSPWLDVSHPGRGIDSGDFDTLENLRAHGYQLCQAPREVQCRAEDAPDVPLDVLGQRVECSPSVGLTCHNRDQVSGLCDNYQVRVLCCHPVPCPTFSGPTASSSAPITHTGLATVPTATVTPSPATATVSVSSAKPGPNTASCRQEQCTWTGWIDGSYPGSSRDSGDFDTFPDLRARGYKFCDRPRSVECRAQFFPDTPLAELEQKVTCNTEVGLLCLNREQLPPMCYNYEIRIQCCEWVDRCGVTSSTPATLATPQPTELQASTSTQATQTPGTHTSWVSTTGTHSTFTLRPHTSTTSVPTTTSTSTLTHTTSLPATTDCRAQCSWTPWFDVDSPEPGSHGGDLETYDHILQKGHSLCRRPEEVTRLQCRAQSHPEVPISTLGQVVRCDRDVGLVCHNRDQQGPAGLCLDYEVRVLCCRLPDGCPSTAVTSTTEASSSAPSSMVSSSSGAPPAPHCFCQVSGQLYPAGSVIYHQTDLDGHCYHALCSWDCHVVRGVDPTCPTPTPSPSTSTHISPSRCLHTVPQRKKGETWPMPKCLQATCEGDNVVSLSPRPCPELTPPFCANGYPALKVADAHGCCQHYQCQCVCSGWGDPHYITFDGTYYTFLDDCTYVLVQQITPVFGHFRVLVDNDFCDLENSVSCPQSIVVEYHEDRVVLTRRPVGGIMTNQILFNGEVVSPGFQKDGIAVSRVGIKMYVTIPELGVQVMFSGLIFSVEVPFSTFANNTEGQCGTCTNDRKDECRMPGGALATSCSEMSKHWRVNTTDQPFCRGPLPTPTAMEHDPSASTSAVPAPPPTRCPPSPICQLILTDVFGPCHAVIEPLPFFEGCVFDHCHNTEPEVVCSSLELYASLCAAQGVCVDWRSWTNNSCAFPCPEDKVYEPCGPSDPPYCYRSDNTSNPALPEAGRITEGCFCPGSLKLFSTNALVCVPEDCPSCPGPHGEPIQPGQIISVDCQECVCDPITKSLTCHQKACPPPPTCHMPGFVSVPMKPKAGQCCPQYSCVCNSSYCPKPQDCPKGSRPTLTHEDGACCPSQNCSWTACSVNGTLYQPGSVVSSSLCETCRCEVPSSPNSDGFLISCETQICNTHCPMGFEYQPQQRQCCGECVQKTCVVAVNVTGQPTRLLLPGESWSDPGNPCVHHTCERYEDRLEVVTVKRECPPLSCARAQAQLSQDGCCLFCPPAPTMQPQEWPCTLRRREQVLQHQNCSSASPVRLAYCEGFCGNSSSKYSLEANAVEHRCRCCQELRTSRATVTLRCADGSSRAFSYTQVEECGCQGLQCQAPASRKAESEESWGRGPRPLQ